jgi:hypothetical protein
MCGQVFRFAVALGLAPRDVAVDLRGPLTIIPRTNHVVITEPNEVAVLMRAIHGYSGSPAAVAALKLAPLVFLRPGDCSLWSGMKSISMMRCGASG